MDGVMPQPHPRSWYAHTANPAPDRPPLAGDLDVDVCVVGAGYTGLVAAIHLAERGFKVAVLEAERVGWGASGRNGGQLITGYNKPVSTLARWVGPEDARHLWDMSEEAKGIVAGLVDRFGIDCDLKWGYLLAGLKPRHMGELAEWRDELEGLGYHRTRLLDRAQIREAVASDRYVGGLIDEGSGQLHPLNYCLGLAAAAESLGVRIFEGSKVTAIDTGPRPWARTGGGTVRAQFLLLAGNAYLGGLVPKLRQRIMPVATYMVATEVLGENRAKALIPGGQAVADVNFVLNYYRRSKDHRLLFGGGVSYSGLDRPDLKQALRRTMVHYFPQLRDVGIDHVWGGHVAITLNRTPHLGRLSSSTLFAQGYSGHGVALTAVCGRLLAEAVAGQAERFDIFARIPHAPFPGPGPLKTPALVLAMLWYRLRDLL